MREPVLFSAAFEKPKPELDGKSKEIDEQLISEINKHSFFKWLKDGKGYLLIIECICFCAILFLLCFLFYQSFLYPLLVLILTLYILIAPPVLIFYLLYDFCYTINAKLHLEQNSNKSNKS